ncbi:MAG: hypothetical protein Q7S21_07515 [archaeon]|nr:hypothetical protein [archaeon]
MPIIKRPSRRPPRNAMLSRTGARAQQTIPKTNTAFHKQAIKGAQRLGAATGKIIKKGREMRAQMEKVTQPNAMIRESVASRFYFSTIETKELEQFFEQYDEQFKANPEALIQAMEESNILPEMFQELEEHMTKEEKLGLIKLLRKYFQALKLGDKVEAHKIGQEAREFISPVRTRAGI